MEGDRLTLRLHQDHAGYHSPTVHLTLILHGMPSAAGVAFEGLARDWRSHERSLTIELPMVPGELKLTGLRSAGLVAKRLIFLYNLGTSFITDSPAVCRVTEEERQWLTSYSTT